MPPNGLQRACVERGQLAGMTDLDAAAPAILIGLPADFIEMHPGWIEIEIEVKINIES
jgi:hypothetical protein